MFCEPGYRFFQHALSSNTGNYLEIGVFNGDSIAGLARSYPQLHIYGVDPFIEDGYTTGHTQVLADQYMPAQKAATMANCAGLDNITMHEMTSREFRDQLTPSMIEQMNVAWVLIDGSHHYEDVITDVDIAMQLIGHKNGGIVFDDVNLPGVGQAHKEFLQMYPDRISGHFDLFALHPGHIQAYLIKEITC